MNTRIKESTRLKTPFGISTDPISEAIHIYRDLSVNISVTEGGNLPVVNQKLGRNLIMDSCNPLEGTIKVGFFLLHDNSHEVVVPSAARLPEKTK